MLGTTENVKVFSVLLNQCALLFVPQRIEEMNESQCNALVDVRRN